MAQGKLLQIELLVLFNWLTLGVFAVLLALLELGPLSELALRLGLFVNIPIAVSYGMFVLKYRPPLGKRLLLQSESNEKKTLLQDFPY